MSSALVTACTANFLIGAKGTLQSARRFHPEIKRFCYCLPKDFDTLKYQLGDLASVITIPRFLPFLPDVDKYQVSWSRIFMCEIPAETVLWIDADAIFCNQASEWWQVPSKKVNVVYEAGLPLNKMITTDKLAWYKTTFGHEPTGLGINAGLVSLHPEEWRNLDEMYESSMQNFPSFLEKFYADQDVANGLYRNCLNILPRIFNSHCNEEYSISSQVKVLHFTRRPKPWQVEANRLRWEHYYWSKFGDPSNSTLVNVANYMRCALIGSPIWYTKKIVRKMRFMAGLNINES